MSIYELDTAAERIRRVAGGESVMAVYTDPEDRASRTEFASETLATAAYQMDAWRLARAYLSNSYYCRKCNGTGRVFVALSGMEPCQRCGGTGSQP